ncbi:MAG: nitroreductase family protein [Myxococcota bacterium]
MTTKTAHTDHPVHALVSERFSPYAWKDESVDAETLRSLFEAARWSASSYNEQPWRFLVARREEPEAFAKLLSGLVEANQVWAQHAPVLAVGLTIRSFSRNGKPNKAYQHDLGLAAATLTFEATSRGLAVHQMIGIDPQRIHDLYALPDDVEPLTALAIGFAGEASALPDGLREREEAPRSRKPLGEIVFSERWEQSAAFLRD